MGYSPVASTLSRVCRVGFRSSDRIALRRSISAKDFFKRFDIAARKFSTGLVRRVDSCLNLLKLVFVYERRKFFLLRPA